MWSTRLALPCVALVLGLGLAGCSGESDDDPPRAEAAATIGDRAITETAVERSIDVLFPHEGGYSKAFGPPRYPRCVQIKRETRATSSTADAKSQCKLEFGVIRAQALSYLLRADWARRESERLHLAGTSRGTIRERADRRLRQLQAAIPVSAAEIARYGKANDMVYADSERRVVDILQTRGRARALRARAQLRNGRPWAQVVDSYGTRPLSRTFNGRHGISESNAPHDAFGRGVFAARVGKLNGPVRTLNGLFLFQVRRVSHVGSDQLSAQARTTILHTLQQERLDDRLHDRYAAVTTCAKRYRVAEVPQCM